MFLTQTDRQTDGHMLAIVNLSIVQFVILLCRLYVLLFNGRIRRERDRYRRERDRERERNSNMSTKWIILTT